MKLRDQLKEKQAIEDELAIAIKNLEEELSDIGLLVYELWLG